VQALQGLVEDIDQLSSLALPSHWARDFFLAHVAVEQHQGAEALSRLQVLNQVGGGSKGGGKGQGGVGLYSAGFKY
jgi:hypothetical protein